MQKFLIQKNDVAKINPQTFLWTYFCYKNFCSKIKVQIFCIFIFERNCVIKSAKKCCVSERLPKKKTLRKFKNFRIFIFARVFFCIYIFVHEIKMAI